MAKDAVVSDEFAKKFAAEKETPYTRWVKSEGLDLISSHLRPEPAHRGTQAVGAARRPRRVHEPRGLAHLERLLRLRDPAGQDAQPATPAVRRDDLVLSGRGSTTVWNDAGQRITFEWRAGALFAIPLNCWHQHYNGSGRDAGALRLGHQRADAINLYEDLDFIFGTEYDFKGRFNGEPDYFATKDERRACCWTPISCRTRSTCR